MVRNSSPWYKMLLVLFLVLMFFLITGVAGLVIVTVSFNLDCRKFLLSWRIRIALTFRC